MGDMTPDLVTRPCQGIETQGIKLFAERLAPLAVTVGLILVSLAVFDMRRLATVLGGVPPAAVALAFGLVLANTLLSCVRYHVLLRDLGVPQPFTTSLHNNAVSLLGGLVFFNFFGQSLSRSALLRREGWSPALAFVVTGIERAVAFALLAAMAVAGALFIFGSMSVGLDHGGELVYLVVNGLAVMLAGFSIGLNHRQRHLLRGVIRDKLARPVLRAGAITIGMHAAMIGAYLALAMAVVHDVALPDVLAVSVIIMFAASLPISFAGWGVRELSAAYAFSMIGQSSEAGLAMAVMIGVLSLTGVVAFALMSTYLPTGRGSVPTRDKLRTSLRIDCVRLLSWGIVIGCGMLVLFQVQLPTESGIINVNLADPFAIMGALTMGAVVIANRRWRTLWQVAGFNRALCVFTIVIATAFFHGWTVFGVTHWALYNRLLGWLVLLSYVFTGALVTSVLGRAGLMTMCRVYVIANAALVVVELLLRFVGPFFGLGTLAWVWDAFYGMVGNPNAYATLLLLALAAALSGGPLVVRKGCAALSPVVLGLLLLGVWFSASRAALVALGCVLALYRYLGVLPWRQLGHALGIAAIVIGVGYLIRHVGLAQGIITMYIVPPKLSGVDMLTQVQVDRRLSVQEGWRMWWSHPLMGAGLGAFMHQQMVTTGIPLVIHNSFLWLLAEVGLVGFLGFMVLPVSIVRAAWVDPALRREWFVATALGGLLAMVVVSLAHDMLYQRAFWLLLGATLARARHYAPSVKHTLTTRHGGRFYDRTDRRD